MPKPHRTRSPGNADLYADPKALAAEIEGKGPVAETIGLLARMWEASLAPFGAAWDAMAPAIGDALADIRKRVIEEGWFNREVTPREVDVTRDPPTADMRLGFKELIAAQNAMLPHTPDHDNDPARRQPDVSGPEM